jgi:hypothetical protein
MASYYHQHRTTGFRICVGSLAQRRPDEIYTVLEVITSTLRRILQVPLHILGGKIALLRYHMPLPSEVYSFDNTVWHSRFGRDIEAYKRYPGLQQREIAGTIMLPRYLKKIEEAQKKPKQLPLFSLDARRNTEREEVI